MTFSKQEIKPYSHELQLNHKRYLDVLKQDFLEHFANPVKREKSAEDFDLMATLGTGAFGTVFLVRDKISLEYLAMKALEKVQVIKKKNVKQLLLEKKILESVTFPFVLNLEFCCKDNVDLKPENIFLTESGYIKLGDFGFCKIIRNRTWTICGTPEYIAPEIILSKGYTFSVDWWSLGILIFEMIAGYPPFYSSDTMKLYEKILAGTFKAPNCMTPACKSLVKSLLDVDPIKRFGSLKAGVFDIKKHMWFEDIDWHSILHQRTYPPYKPVIKNIGDTSNFYGTDNAKLKKSPECLFEKEFEHF
ncbi:cAMP-dependent protein kinase catalytic subunit beta-like [Zerene cesonia]|uniref:cAMP-dependent protein kinase catalytic subunit beta-like n=1 Tax=Zerene cesonia TaxID=33412 RepID=UPI0018E560E5|nr:cAMP-dependent protein kinase catalytic subunit beta-like [Zerene cesonia]